MRRSSSGPRLRLFGPDGRHGAKKRAKFKSYVWYIVWTESGDRKERSTGVELGGDPEPILQQFLAERAAETGHEEGPRDPAETYITEALTHYSLQKAGELSNPGRYAAAVRALTPFWKAYRISQITETKCRAYVGIREKAGRKVGTARRELEDLQGAIRFYEKDNRITYAPNVWLPPKPPARDRWLTRSEVARLLRTAKANKRSRWYLPLFIQIAVRTGARTSAILQLQWIPNTEGGHVDLEAGVIDLNPVGRPQNKKRRPRLPIPRPLVWPLRLARRRTSRYVCEHHGNPIRQLRRSLPKALRDAGLKDVGDELNKAVAHTFRHTAITWSMQAGPNKFEICGFFGISMQMLEQVYGHHHPDYLKEAKAAMERRPGGNHTRLPGA